MRFLLGLLLGAAVVLGGAEGVSRNADWRARLSALSGYLQHKVGAAFTTGAAEQPPPPAPVGAGAPEPADQPIPRPPDPEPQEVRRTAGAGKPAKAAASAPADEVAGAFPAAEAAGASPAPSERGADVDPVTEMALPDDPGAELASVMADSPDPDAAEPASQPVWAPFHSEMSASGFAERLSEQLDHPFRVERRGPGHYQVVFAYADEPQRRRLLDRAAEATGLPL